MRSSYIRLSDEFLLQTNTSVAQLRGEVSMRGLSLSRGGGVGKCAGLRRDDGGGAGGGGREVKGDNGVC